MYIDRFVDLSPEGEVEVLSGGHKYAYDGNWKFQTENTADNYHVDFTHTTLRDLYKRRKELNGQTAYSMGPGRVVESRLRNLGHGHSVNDRPFGQTLLELAPVNADVRRYLDALEARLGPERAREAVMQAGPVPYTFRMFPNLVLIQSQIRVIFPISPGRTEVWSTPTRLKGLPDEVNAMRIRYHEDLHGPAGFGSPDDTEMFERNQRGLQAKGDEWLVMSRGLGREETDEHGNVVGEIISETGLRAIWREWRRLMMAG
jgi:phenylpropionate dioxygenase-like ring-hydroxylating dioxygenase large terminal subunit